MYLEGWTASKLLGRKFGEGYSIREEAEVVNFMCCVQTTRCTYSESVSVVDIFGDHAPAS